MVSRVKAPLKLIDLCDYLILGRNTEKVGHTSTTFYYMMSLYEQMGIPTEVIHTDYEITQDDFQYLKSVFGEHVVLHNKLDTDASKHIAHLLEDIPKVLEFHEIHRYWDALHTKTPSSPTTIDPWGTSSLLHPAKEPPADVRPYDKYETAFTSPYHKRLPYEFSVSLVPFKSSFIGDPPHTDHTFKNPTGVSFLILYNHLFRTTLLVKTYVQEDFIREVCTDYPAFEILSSYENIPWEVEKVATELFHKKVFDSKEEALKKISSFNTLYNDITPSCQKTAIIDDLKYIIYTALDITEDSTDRIRSSELHTYMIKQIPNIHLTYPDRESLQRFMTSYLSTLGLKKKRYDDGVFYYNVRYTTRYQDSLTNSS